MTAEGQTKSSYEQDLNYVSGKTFKVQTTTRVTSELKWADEDNRFQIIQSIQADQAEAIGRALDYVVYHAINPKTGEPLTGFDALTARAMRGHRRRRRHHQRRQPGRPAQRDLRHQRHRHQPHVGLPPAQDPRTRHRHALLPEIPLNLQVGTLDGIKAATSATVNGAKAKDTHPRARHHGRFQPHQMGHGARHHVRDHPHGDPDQTGVDLKAHNQIAYRTEGHVLLRGRRPQKAFAVLKTSTEEGA